MHDIVSQRLEQAYAGPPPETEEDAGLVPGMAGPGTAEDGTRDDRTWFERWQDRRRAATVTPGSRTHAFRHHQPRTIAAQAADAEQAPEGTYDAWHQRWIAGPGTRVSVAVDWVIQDGRHFWGAVALLASALALLAATIHLVA